MAGDRTEGSRRSVVAALISNSAVAVIKFAAAALTGSASMFAEAVHSVADTGNEGLLLVGMRKARQPADRRHPFGRGQERFFWSFVVAVSLFTVGAAVSVFQGVSELINGHEVKDAGIALAVLGLAALLECYGFFTALHQLRRLRDGRSVGRTLREVTEPEVLTVLAEDSAALTGIAVAAACIGASALTGNATYDACGSIGVGCVLAVAAFLLARDTRHLLLGESASPQVREAIAGAIEEEREVDRAVEVLTMHTGPNELLVTADVAFRDGLDTDGVEDAIDRIEARIAGAVPEARRIYIEPEERGERVRRAARAGAERA
jgi:cation diffusion facilitator family transporter